MADTQTPPPGSPLEDIQDHILNRLHAGEPVEQGTWVGRHPEHAEPLQRFFQILNVLEVPPDPALDKPVRLGEYEIGPEIGRGGMGVVYRALQMPLNRPVALKILPPALRQDRRLLKRFQRESAAAGRLRHPNIVPVYSVGEAGGAPFFAMEFVDGCSLADLLRLWKQERDESEPTVSEAGLPTVSASAAASDPATSGNTVHCELPYPDALPHSDAERIEWAVQLMAKVLDALDYAHAEGIVHRDVKPGNILTEADGTPRLTDFGLALDLAATELTVTGEVFGSPLYMSPEQAFRREAPLDARTDIYSVGVTLYELLALRLPYAGASRNALISAMGDGQLVPLSEALPGVPPALEAVVHKALNHEPEQRFRRAGDFATALRDALAHPTQLPPGVPKLSQRLVGGGTAARAWWRRHPILTALLVVLALMGTLATVSTLFLLLSGVSADPNELTSNAPSTEQLMLMADGLLPDGEEVLDTWFQPTLHVRSLVARDAPGKINVAWQRSDPGLPPDTWVGMSLSLLVDGEEKSTGGFMFRASPPKQGFSEAGTDSPSNWVFRPSLGELLEGHLHKEFVTLKVSATLRVQHTDGASQDGNFKGTEVVRVFQPRTLLIGDTYPDDYPVRVSDPLTDVAMQKAFTPDRVRLNDWESMADKAAQLFVTFGNQSPTTVPACFGVELLAPDSDVPLGTAPFSMGPIPPIDDMSRSFLFAFDAPKAAEAGAASNISPEHQAYLSALAAGEVDSVRLRFRSSREVALEQPDVEHYWGGSFIVELPLDL